MLGSSLVSLFFYSISFALLLTLPESTWGDMWNPWLWIFILISMLGVFVGNIRMITLSTLVTLMIPEGERDKANGQIGAVNGLVFSVVSVFSGFVIGRLGMTWALGIVLGITLIVIIHILALPFPREEHLE